MRAAPSPQVSSLLAALLAVVTAPAASQGDDFLASLKLSNVMLVKVPGDGKTAAREVANHGQWHFRHALEGPAEGPPGHEQVNHWYVVWSDRSPETKFFGKPYWWTVFENAPEIVEATRAEFGVYPLLIEPNHTFRYKAVAKTTAETVPASAVRAAPGSREVVYRNLPSPAWPDVLRPADDKTGRAAIDPFWYLGDRFSQLEKAREFVGPARDGQRIKIGHLDTGLDGNHPGVPPHLVRRKDDYRANAYGLLQYAEDSARYQAGVKVDPTAKPPPTPSPPEKTNGTHGLGTIGLLAGGTVHLPTQTIKGVTIAGYNKPIGGAPEAEVYPVCVAPSVASLSTAELAYAIDYASRLEGCDVISMSHGGSPSQAWVDAVNAAYDRGTAMFAAEGDFYTLSFYPLPAWGIVVPSSPVYPAAFRRVLGVTGVTAENTSHGYNRLSRLLAAPGSILSWMLRGSYGADGTSTVFFRPNHYPDGSELKRGGPLRPQPIAAYSPNIPWLAVNQPKGQLPQYVVDLDGAGTSAATPQVAAAAALWLQKHRQEFSSREWHGWQKPEAVYCALLSTAHPPDDSNRPDPFLGAGTLKAYDALRVTYAEVRRMQRPPQDRCEQGHHDPGRGLYFARSGRDHFDAQRSFVALLGFDSLRNLPYDQRADLFQWLMPDAKPEDEIRRFFYNTLLIQAWQEGHLPNKKHGSEDLWLKAERQVARTSPHYTPLAREDLLRRVGELCPPPPDDPCLKQPHLLRYLPGFPPDYIASPSR